MDYGANLQLYQASVDHEDSFVLGSVDVDSQDPWVFQAMEANIQHCIDEKAEKITKANARERYPEWWLLLADVIGYGLGGNYQEYFKRRTSHRRTFFAKVILINPLKPDHAFEI